MSTSGSRIGILKTGTTAAEVRSRYGDFDRWFEDALAGEGLRFEVQDVTDGEARLDGEWAGVIVTGSPASVCAPGPWLDPFAAFLRDLAASGLPLLGVCFGAQVLAHAFGSRVVRNPRGWEIGGIELSLTDAALRDPLFEGLPRTMGALATHEDVIETLPEGAVLLASNPSSPVQAFRLPGRVWGVQFHPEITPDILRILIEVRRGTLERDARQRGLPAEGHVEGLLATLEDPSVVEGRRLLKNFASLCRENQRATSSR